MSQDESSHSLALFGITGALGREIQASLEVEHDGIAQLLPVAGPASAGQVVRWRGASLSLTGPAALDPSAVDFAIFATPAEVVSRTAPRLLDAGARVIDASGVLAAPPLPRALTAPAPTVWPRLSTFAAVDFEDAIALVLPSAAASTLAPLLDALTHPATGLPRLEAAAVTVLLPASHAGQRGIDALSRQTVGLLNYQPAVDPRPFPAALAFNAIAPPPEDTVLFENRTQTELGALLPTLAAASLELTPIWIAAFSGLVATVHLRFADDVDPASLTRALSAHPDLSLGPAADDDASASAPGDDDAADPSAVETEPEAAGSEADASPGDDPTALSLRAVLDSERVHLSTPLVSGRSVRLVAMADPIHRTAQAATTLLARWFAALA